VYIAYIILMHTESPRASSTSSLLKSLHWLPVRQRVIYKTALITYKIYHQPARTLRSSSQLLLYQPATRINFQSKAFSTMTPAVWHSLSSVTQSSATITTFKAHLKTELFSAAYDTV